MQELIMVDGRVISRAARKDAPFFRLPFSVHKTGDKTKYNTDRCIIQRIDVYGHTHQQATEQIWQHTVKRTQCRSYEDGTDAVQINRESQKQSNLSAYKVVQIAKAIMQILYVVIFDVFIIHTPP